MNLAKLLTKAAKILRKAAPIVVIAATLAGKGKIAAAASKVEEVVD